MLFNIHHGQVRFTSLSTGSKPIFRNKRPMGMLIMRKLDGSHPGIYRADERGNIDVVPNEHIDVMVGQGWPIYDGDGKMSPVPLDDLIYPNNDLASSYWQRINEAKATRG